MDNNPGVVGEPEVQTTETGKPCGYISETDCVTTDLAQRINIQFELVSEGDIKQTVTATHFCGINFTDGAEVNRLCRFVTATEAADGSSHFIVTEQFAVADPFRHGINVSRDIVNSDCIVIEHRVNSLGGEHRPYHRKYVQIDVAVYKPVDVYRILNKVSLNFVTSSAGALAEPLHGGDYVSIDKRTVVCKEFRDKQCQLFQRTMTCVPPGHKHVGANTIVYNGSSAVNKRRGGMNFAGNIGNADIIPTDLKIIESIEIDITETKCQNMHILITQVWYQKFLRIDELGNSSAGSVRRCLDIVKRTVVNNAVCNFAQNGTVSALHAFREQDQLDAFGVVEIVVQSIEGFAHVEIGFLRLRHSKFLLSFH